MKTETNSQDERTNESPKGDVREYAKRYGYAGLGYAILRMMEEGDFTPKWKFAQRLWEYEPSIDIINGYDIHPND